MVCVCVLSIVYSPPHEPGVNQEKKCMMLDNSML